MRFTQVVQIAIESLRFLKVVTAMDSTSELQHESSYKTIVNHVTIGQSSAHLPYKVPPTRLFEVLNKAKTKITSPSKVEGYLYSAWMDTSANSHYQRDSFLFLGYIKGQDQNKNSHPTPLNLTIKP
ncbi:hypothetical protein CDAR_590971 [Caerostris darwini]|uniref:Uncharacterized protein n=1 Tax=Caerostris darwini TaxID=1538125 RepID=A0AAV4Q0M9_9ARAC|nr:hypothetical protein CDAR_590971 [Caerostris darwini]